MGDECGKVLFELKGHSGIIVALKLVVGPLGGLEEELFSASQVAQPPFSLEIERLKNSAKSFCVWCQKAMQDRTVRVWNVFNGECLRILRFDIPPIVAMHISDDTLFVAGGEIVHAVQKKVGEVADGLFFIFVADSGGDTIAGVKEWAGKMSVV